MTSAAAIALCHAALLVLVKVMGPMLAAALLVGLIVGVLQAATQINEASIAFVAKLLTVVVVLVLVGSWTFRQLTDYTARTISSIAHVVR
jgi:flagellar biosynthetic protein FliQ